MDIVALSLTAVAIAALLSIAGTLKRIEHTNRAFLPEPEPRQGVQVGDVIRFDHASATWSLRVDGIEPDGKLDVAVVIVPS